MNSKRKCIAACAKPNLNQEQQQKTSGKIKLIQEQQFESNSRYTLLLEVKLEQIQEQHAVLIKPNKNKFENNILCC